MNALQELKAIVGNTDLIVCAQISHRSYNGDASSFEKPATQHKLRMNRRPEEMIEFLESLDFDYDDGYGAQELDGTIWLTDGSWLTREEYDGSEWWRRHILPSIPQELL